MIAFLIEIARFVQRLKPVAGTKEHSRKFQPEFTQCRFEIISPMAVQDKQLVNVLPVQYFAYISKDGILGAWVEVDVELDVCLSRVHSKRNRWKNYQFGSFFPCDATGFRRDKISFYHISCIRQVIIM